MDLMSVLISINPDSLKKIFNGTKTIELRKTLPTLSTPFKVYIYCTKDKTKDDEIMIGEYKGNGKVVAQFICNDIKAYNLVKSPYNESQLIYNASLEDIERTGLTYEEIEKYGDEKPLYGWFISDLIIYDGQSVRPPKSLHHFVNAKNYAKRNGGDDYEGEKSFLYNIIKYKQLEIPPMSWCYVIPLFTSIKRF